MFSTVFMTVIVGVVFFFAATRTQVGRNELRQEFQRQFNERFAGSLRIGQLQGNLVNDFFASDVQILDPSGQPVLTIDSLVARPRWQTLFSRRLAFRSITAVRPRLMMHRAADSTWSIHRAFARRNGESVSTFGTPDFTLADLYVRDGTISSTREGAPPALSEDGWIFDYTEAEVANIQAHVTMEWSSQDELIDVLALSARLPTQNLRIEQLQGQILGTEDQWTLNQFRLRTDATELAFDGALTKSDDAAPPTSLPEIELDVAESHINFDEMGRLIPRLPFADAATVEAHVRGPLDGLVLESFRMDHGQSHLAMEGTVIGLPERVDYELAVYESRLTPQDIRTLVPEAPLPPIEDVGQVDLSIYSRGIIPLRTDSLNMQATSDLVLQSGAGTLVGDLQFTQRANRPVDYNGHFRVDSLNLAPFLRKPAYESKLTGTAKIVGRGLRRASAHSRLNVALAPSSVAGRPVDSLQAEIRADAGLFRTSLELWGPHGGYVQAEGDLDLQAAHPTYHVTASTRDFNLQTLPIDRLPVTRLTAQITSRGSGFSIADATGRVSVQLDSSSVDYGRRTHLIPPNRTDLVVAERSSAAPRIELTGDVATLRVDGDVALEPLWALSNLWGHSAAAALRRELDKPYNPPLASAASRTTETAAMDPAASVPSDIVAQWQTRARQALLDAGYTSDLTVETTFAVHRSDVLEALVPFLPTLRTDLNGRVTVTAGADRIALQSHLQGQKFTLEGLTTEAPTVQLQAAGNLHAPLAETFVAELSVHGTKAQIGPVALQAPRLTFDYTDRQGILRFESDRNGETGPIRLAAAADLLPDRNELTLYDAHLEADGHAWTTVHPSTMDAYADALIVPDLLLESVHPTTNRTQRLRVHGTFSASPRDTMFAEASNVLLQPFSELADFVHPVGGSLDATVALSGGWDAPRVSGATTVDWLSFDRRLLGQLRLASHYELGAPDVRIDATLTPTDSVSADSIAVPSFLPYRPLRSEENRLALRGRVHLPGAAATTTRMDQTRDFFDLQLSVARADLFFFEYIFEGEVRNVSGHLTGDAHIGGALDHPLFSADLQAVDAQFDMPKFNLHYDLAGPISVDGEGIKLDEVEVHESDGGQATVSGAVLFNAYEYFSFDLSATLDEMRIIDVESSQDLPFYGSISASGTVTLTGPLSDATLRANDARTTADSELFIPVQEDEVDAGTGFILFADSTGHIPNFREITRRENILADRPEGEPTFLDALDLDINLLAPEGSTIHLVFDPLLGDVITANGAGRVQIQRQEGEFYTYGTLEVSSGEYLFTAGEVFVRRFTLEGGTITWDGNPTNAQLDLDASYRTRASTAGLSEHVRRQRIPVVIHLDITGRVETPRVNLSLAIDSRDRNTSFVGEALQSVFNQPDLATDDLATEYATSVLLTNTFLLTTSSVTSGQQTAGNTGDRLTNAGNQLAFNSLSQLVASQLNRYLSEALPNLDVNLGLQGEDPEDLDVIYGVALRLLDERLIIRGEGVYQSDEVERRRTEGIEGEFIVEVRLSRNVSVQAFYRRMGDEMLNNQTLTSTTGAGLSYQTEFTTWRNFLRRLFEWFIPGDDDLLPEDAPNNLAITPPDTLATDPRTRP